MRKMERLDDEAFRALSPREEKDLNGLSAGVNIVRTNLVTIGATNNRGETDEGLDFL